MVSGPEPATGEGRASQDLGEVVFLCTTKVVQDARVLGTNRLHCQGHLRLMPMFPKSLLDDYKDYGVNCDKMASEIEDHILELCQGCGCLDCPAAVSRVQWIQDTEWARLFTSSTSVHVESNLTGKVPSFYR